MNGEAKREGDELPIACDPAALDAGQRERRRLLQQRLRADVREIRELPDGYAFRYPPEPSVCLAVAEFITLERLCCPFFDFALEVERNGGSLWLRMTGGEEARRILKAELGIST